MANLFILALALIGPLLIYSECCSDRVLVVDSLLHRTALSNAYILLRVP